MRNILLAVPFLWASSAIADNSLNFAYKMHQQLACEPADRDTLREMSDLIKSGDSEAAAAIALKNEGFYNCTLKIGVYPKLTKQNQKRWNLMITVLLSSVLRAMRYLSQSFFIAIFFTYPKPQEYQPIEKMGTTTIRT